MSSDNTIVEIKDKRFGEERALYNLRSANLKNCNFSGEEDGESALKECENISLDSCFMDLRYPLWHCTNFSMNNCEQTENCRAAIWYSTNVKVNNCRLHGIKIFRECKDVTVVDTDFISPEAFWRCDNINLKNVKLDSVYSFFESKNIKIDGINFVGKYSFQYTENVEVSNAIMNTKDAFWHCKNCVIKDSTLEGEYSAWYADGLTLINCKIIGTQPFCYCKNLKLINCTMEKTDLSFEYSNVEAEINNNIVSVKNPISGKIVAESIGQIILEDSKYPCNAVIIDKSKSAEQPH